ncbi:maltooligosyltrehalose trehalohydrolase [Curtobacterium luteum]|uniref:Malto-oligosyltrehalose trehalohydrolase n=1 Tax=Curtobacterium luteum TaxID=33881 RepID=A0A8H9GB83_9MICO|nr:malto-oligosyltrehalose trehalohydrolase [Curtobacterium luteum]MBM7800866.1 maltooligosyltrehalose trehalohydrolase [Curtobacterium luteum]NUU49556.1 malto-oligosyltrehalose trehalohydrolase [Curtobacterium luteum]GGL09362.1 malto-oligosyltrehalose trehalohydrolase [Curtobacterium luteum]
MTVPARYAVWAPDPDRVRLVVDDVEYPLTRGADDWWTTDAVLPHVGARYGFRIDDDDAVRPDPRSRFQPEGVHGPSEVVDPERFAWTDDAWTGRPARGGVIYEMHVGTFTPEGTLDAAADRLEHLVELGVSFVEVLPVNGFNGEWNWGYDGVAWYAVQHTYGGPDAYDRFVDRAHALGLGVIQDVVYNHLGPSGNYLPLYGPYLLQGLGNTWGDSVNVEHPEVRRYVLDNVRMWFRDHHVDGLRLDAVHAIRDTTRPHVLAAMAEETDAYSSFVGRPLSLIAESDLNDPIMFRPREAAGYGLAGQWSDDFHHAVHVALTGETNGYYGDFAPLSALAKVLDHGFFHDGTWSSFRKKRHGRPIDRGTSPTTALVVANQNHDQIGNRAAGDRLAATLDDESLVIAAALTLLGPFTPMLFMGEEFAAATPWQFFTSHPEPELGKVTAEGRIKEFAEHGWDESIVPDPQDPETFRRSKLDWSSLDGERESRILTAYRVLVALRRTEQAFVDHRYEANEVHLSEDRRWLVLSRGLLGPDAAPVHVVVNFADDVAEVPVPTAQGEELYRFGEATVERGGVRFTGRGVVVVR